MPPRRIVKPKIPAKAKLTPQEQYPYLPLGLARFAASLKLSGASRPRSKRGIGCLEPGLVRFAAGIVCR